MIILNFNDLRRRIDVVLEFQNFCIENQICRKRPNDNDYDFGVDDLGKL